MNEGVKLVNVLQLGVTVEEESCMVRVSQPRMVEGLEVVREVVDALHIQKAADDIAGLQLPDSGHISGHGSVVVVLGIKVVAVATLHVRQNRGLGLHRF
jgi:hypothetical protein